MLDPLLPFELSIHILHHFQEFLLGENPFLHEQPRKGFLLDHLGQEEFIKGDDLFGVRASMMSAYNQPG